MSLKVVKLVAENIKKLKAVKIIPQGNLIKITGKNEQGKTTVLDCIWWALEGAKNVQKRPIRTGEKEGKIELTLGDNEGTRYIVTRKFTQNKAGGYLTVETLEGAEFKSPQAALNKLLGALSFDPLEYTRQKPPEQKKEMLKIGNISVDIAEMDNKIKDIYDRRTDVNKDKSTLKVNFKSLQKPDDDIPEEELKTTDVMKEMRASQKVIDSNNIDRAELVSFKNRIDNEVKEAESVDKDVKDCKDSIKQTDKDVKGCKDRIKKIRNEIKEYNEKINLKKNEIEKFKVKKDGILDSIYQSRKEYKAEKRVVDELEDPKLDQFEKKLTDVENTNKKIRDAKEYYESKIKYQAKIKESDILTEKIKAIEETKDNALQEADFPVDGLSVDEDGVLYNGLPFEQASQEEQLRVSIGMAMAMNPELRVIRTTNASLLDEEKLKVIADMAKNNDYQIWAEMVDSSGKVGIFIEDGMVKAVNK